MLSTLQQNWNKAGCDSISDSTASLNNVDDGQADEPANILEDTDSDKELEKERQEWSESGRLRSKKAKANPWVGKIADWQTKHAWLNEQGGKMFYRTFLKHNKNNSMTKGNFTLTEYWECGES